MFYRSRFATLVILVLAILAVATGVASAQSAGTTFQVQANVLKRCTVSVTGLTFADYDPLAGTAVDGQTVLSIACTKNSTATIVLDKGTRGDRTLSDGTSFLTYDLYSDASRSVVWNAASPVIYTAENRDTAKYDIYGRILADQDVPGGHSYSDTVTVSVNY